MVLVRPGLLPIRPIQAYTKHIGVVPAYRFARGLAYAKKGLDEAAKEDFSQVLPSMIRSLRYIDAATMFDYADDPVGRLRHKPSPEKRLARMINRLRMSTGQNFGYDPNGTEEQNEQAISAWEQWFESLSKIQVNPDAELVEIPQE